MSIPAVITSKKKHARRWTFPREFFDRFAPRLFPGKHRYCHLLDYTPHRMITNHAAFQHAANNHTGATR